MALVFEDRRSTLVVALFAASVPWFDCVLAAGVSGDAAQSLTAEAVSINAAEASAEPPREIHEEASKAPPRRSLVHEEASKAAPRRSLVRRSEAVETSPSSSSSLLEKQTRGKLSHTEPPTKNQSCV